MSGREPTPRLAATGSNLEARAYTRGAAEALAEVAERIADLGGTEITYRAVRQILERVSAELGLDGDAPSARVSSPQSAEQPPVGGPGGTEGSEERSGGCRETIWDGPYAMRCGLGDGRTCPRHGVVI